MEFAHDRSARESRANEKVSKLAGKTAEWRLISHVDSHDEEKTTYDLHSPPGTKFKVRQGSRDFNALTIQRPGNLSQETHGLTLDEVEEILADRPA